MVVNRIKMLGNVLSGIVNLEYTLMRCIHWAVYFSWQVGVSTKPSIYFRFFNFNCYQKLLLMDTLLWDVFIGPSASHQQVTGGRALQKPSIDFWFLFVSKFRICPLFTEVSWNEMLGNVWSGIVTLEYTLMGCILWAVCFL